MPAASQAAQQAVSKLPQQAGQPTPPSAGQVNVSEPQVNQADFQNWLRNQPAGSTSGRYIPPQQMNQPSPQALSQGLQQQAAMQNAVNASKGGQPPAPSGNLRSSPAIQAAINNAAQTGQANMQNPKSARQIPMSMQRQPQAAGRMPQQPMQRPMGRSFR